MGGLAAILGTAGQVAIAQAPVLFRDNRGGEGRLCARIRASCVLDHYMGEGVGWLKWGGGDGETERE